MTNAQHQKLKPLSLSLGIRKHLGNNFNQWRKNHLIHIWWFSSLYKMMTAVRQDIHCSNLNTLEKSDLPVTCNNDIKSIRDIWYFFLIPMQCHRAHSCSTKCSRIGIYITLNIWMSRNSQSESKKSQEGKKEKEEGGRLLVDINNLKHACWQLEKRKKKKKKTKKERERERRKWWYQTVAW